MAKELLVGVDLGGTSLLAVATSIKGKILGEKKVQDAGRGKGRSAVLERIVRTIEDAVSERRRQDETRPCDWDRDARPTQSTRRG